MSADSNLPLNKILCGHVIDLLREMPDDSIDLVVTSPPYWALREYSGAESIWGGDPDCQHSFSDGESDFGRYCSRCGAWYGQLGLEPSPFEYIDHLVDVFREVKRVLKPTGSIYLNIGDTMSQSGGAGGQYDKLMPVKSKQDTVYVWGKSVIEGFKKYRGHNVSGLPAKSKCLIPERLVIRLVDELGFACRNNVIWYKPNNMPDSVKDRFTNTYENIYFLVKNTVRTLCWRNRLTGEWIFSKPESNPYVKGSDIVDEWSWWCPCGVSGSSREEYSKHPIFHPKQQTKRLWRGYHYYFDLDSVRIPNQVMGVTDKRPPGIVRAKRYEGSQERYSSTDDPHLNQFKLSKRTESLMKFFGKHGSGGNPGHGIHGSTLHSSYISDKGKNPGDVGYFGDLRHYRNEDTIFGRNRGKQGDLKGKNPADFWEINTQPYKEAHFAVFPITLCLRPILASCPPSGIVLDPFGGSGTVAEAVEVLNILGRMPHNRDEIRDIVNSARDGQLPLQRVHNRKWILFDISRDYCQLAFKRLKPYVEDIEILSL